MIATIAKKEFTELFRDGRFRWSALIVFALLVVSLATGWQNYSTVKREQEAAQAESRKAWEGQGERNPHSAAHFGVYAFRPKVPLSLIDPGLDKFTGSSIWVEAHYQNPMRNRPISDTTALQRFGDMTASTILLLLLPLLIIFLTFDAFAGERASGTLRQVLSAGASRRNIAFGKMIGIFSVLMMLLVPATILGVLALGLSSSGESLLLSIPRFGVLCLGYLLYFAAFIGTALTVSVIASSVRIALVALLAFWIIGCLLIPRLGNDVAERAFAVPGATQFWESVRKDLKEGIDGHAPADVRTKELEKKILAQYGVERLEDLPINFNGISLDASEQHANTVFDKHYAGLWRTYYAQEQIHKWTGIVSPLMPAKLLSMGMAGTDLRHTQHFTDSVEQYRRDFNRELNLYFAYNSSQKEGYNYFAGEEFWKTNLDFRYSQPGVFWALGWQISNLGLLLVWAIGALAIAVFAASRMGVD